MRWVGDVARMGRDVYRILLGKPEGKRPLGRTRRKWENNKVGHQEVECGEKFYIDVAQDKDRWWALVNTVMNLWVP
jgi:hypothetical protein